ncbi:sodium:glutamate symporter, partial [Phascolarctobacterium faecium]|uniref:sodium/glutamate symporter n=1 Tax=Phascolarctobacterium faecium TaxID=33025 RepID=UPI0027322590
LMGRDYEAAVIRAAGCGFGLGATPNAMANMNAIVARYGPAPIAYFIVPLVGSLLIDFIYAFFITLFLNMF